MESGRKSINELFGISKFFYVPDYQRSYAWEDKQINDFFDDFKANYNGVNKRYYYGTILLQDKGTEGAKERYDIVDGQQRLTTLIVFIKCLLDRVRKIKERPEFFDDETIDDTHKEFIIYKGNYHLCLQSDDTEFFHTYVLSDNEPTENDFRTPSQKRLFHLKERFIELLSKVNDEVALSFLEKINATNILVYLVGSRSEASLIFETTNDRGKQLTNIEKTKSYLMYKASLLDDSEQLLKTIQTRFNLIYHDYASFEGRQIGEDSILQYTFIAYEDWNNTGKQKEYQHYMESMKTKSEDLLNKNDFDGFRKYVEDYTLNIRQSFSTIKSIFNNQVDEFKDLVALNVLSPFYPLLIKTYSYDNLEKNQFKKICRLLEIFIFRVYHIQNYLTNKFQTKWYELAKRFSGDFDSLCNSIISLIRSPEVGDDESFIKALENEDFFNKYNSTTKNYFFWKYENYLRTIKQPISTPMPHDDLKKVKGSKTNLSIEHIVARKNTEEHSKIIADEGIIKVGHGKKFNNEYLNSIGNLTIDPQSANSSKGKKDVEEKVSKYFNKAPYKCQNELEEFMVAGKWQLESLENRKKALIKFAKETWCTYDKFYVNEAVVENVDDVEEDDDSEV